jgi:hypothetical protein
MSSLPATIEAIRRQLKPDVVLRNVSDKEAGATTAGRGLFTAKEENGRRINFCHDRAGSCTGRKVNPETLRIQSVGAGRTGVGEDG